MEVLLPHVLRSSLYLSSNILACLFFLSLPLTLCLDLDVSVGVYIPHSDAERRANMM